MTTKRNSHLEAFNEYASKHDALQALLYNAKGKELVVQGHQWNDIRMAAPRQTESKVVNFVRLTAVFWIIVLAVCVSASLGLHILRLYDACGQKAAAEVYQAEKQDEQEQCLYFSGKLSPEIVALKGKSIAAAGDAPCKSANITMAEGYYRKTGRCIFDEYNPFAGTTFKEYIKDTITEFLPAMVVFQTCWPFISSMLKPQNTVQNNIV